MFERVNWGMVSVEFQPFIALQTKLVAPLVTVSNGMSIRPQVGPGTLTTSTVAGVRASMFKLVSLAHPLDDWALNVTVLVEGAKVCTVFKSSVIPPDPRSSE